MHGFVFARPLLATEHGEFDSGAEALAMALALRCQLGLAGVLPVTSNPEYESVAPQLAARSDADAAARCEDLKARALAQGVQLDLRVRRGPEPFIEIVEEARRCAADLIVIRRRGKRGLLANLLVGEMVSKVVAHAPCCLLIAPRGAQMWSRRILVGLDPLAVDSGLLARASAIAQVCALPLHVLCVTGNAAGRAAAQKVLDAALAGLPAGVAASGEVRVGRPHEELIAARAAQDADLVVIGRHGRQNLGRAWIGGVAQKVIGLADCPVLIHIDNPKPLPATP